MRKLILAILIAQGALAAELPNAVFVLRNSRVAPEAFRAFQQRVGASACECLLATEDHPELTAERLHGARLLFLEHPSAELLERLEAPAREAIARGMQVVTDVPSIVQRAWGVEMSAPLTLRLMDYWSAGGKDNLLGFFLAAYREAGGPADFEIPPPVALPETGVYHPDAPQLFSGIIYLTHCESCGMMGL